MPSTQNDLFGASPSTNAERIDLNPGYLTHYKTVLPSERADQIFEYLKETLAWQQPSIKIHGKTLPIPRLQVWMGDSTSTYTYSDRQFSPVPWHPMVEEVKDAIETLSRCQYNSVLCNYYRDGQDSVSWHADDESELDTSVPIASYSLGETRRFDLKPKHPNSIGNKLKIELTHNSALLMSPEVQQHWLHQIPKTRRVIAGRINLTFRKITPH